VALYFGAIPALYRAFYIGFAGFLYFYNGFVVICKGLALFVWGLKNMCGILPQ
jgi:hypothetical protein